MERGFSIVQSADGGFVIGGTYYSIAPQYDNFYAIKLDSMGNLKWTNSIGGYMYHHSGSDDGYSITKSYDGGYALVGRTLLYGAGEFDVYVVKLDSSGTRQWSKSIGGSNWDQGFSIIQTKDFGYAITGATESFGAGSNDVYVIKLDSAGGIQWTRTIGGAGDDQGYSIIQTTDRGYAITGFTNSYGAGGYDVYVVKLDSAGNLQWTKTIGGSKGDDGYSIIQSSDGGYAITGVTESFNDTIYGDVYVIKLDSGGNLKWTRTIGDTIGEDIGQSIIQADNGDFVITGYTSSYGAGYDDVYFIRLDTLGNLLQTRTFGGIEADYGESIIKTKNKGFAICGFTSELRSPWDDVFILTLDSLGNNCDSSGRGGKIDSGGIAGSGGSITSYDSGRVETGGSSFSHGTITNICGTINSVANIKSISNNFELSPNPCTNTLNISFETPTNLSSIQIMDITGRVLLTYDLPLTTNDYPIDVSSISSGMYFIRINSGSGTEVRKFIKE